MFTNHMAAGTVQRKDDMGEAVAEAAIRIAMAIRNLYEVHHRSAPEHVHGRAEHTWHTAVVPLQSVLQYGMRVVQQAPSSMSLTARELSCMWRCSVGA